MNGVKLRAGDLSGGTAIAVKAADLGAHLGERVYDSLHRTLLYGRVPGQSTRKRLGSQNHGDQAGGGAAVAAV